MRMQKKELRADETPVTVKGITATELHEYTAQLKAKVPCDLKRFADAGMKAEHYTAHEHYPDLFQQLTIRVESVTSTDRLTGKSERYTRARLTLGPLDPPESPRVGDLRGAANRAYASAMKP